MSLLRPHNDGGRKDLVPPPAVIVEDEIEYFVEKIFLTGTWLMKELSILSNGLDLNLRRIHGWHDLL